MKPTTEHPDVQKLIAKYTILDNMYNSLKKKNEELRNGIINDRDDIVLLTKAKYDTLKQSHEDLWNAISTCVGIIKASAQVNTKNLADMLEQALAEAKEIAK